jgi:hypothetical protein
MLSSVNTVCKWYSSSINLFESSLATMLSSMQLNTINHRYCLNDVGKESNKLISLLLSWSSTIENGLDSFTNWVIFLEI